MSSRRLAISQPDNYELSDKSKQSIKAWVKKYPKGRQRSALIPALWIAQNDNNGWLPEAALRQLGDMLDMAYIRVYEVATFYTMFNLAPVGEHHIQLCGTTPCWLRGAEDLKEVLKKRIGPSGSVSNDGKLSWIEVECLGACANAPMAQISNKAGHDYYEDLNADNLAVLLDGLSEGRHMIPGPQNSRYGSEPEGEAKTLIDEGYIDRKQFSTLPNCDKKIKLNYYQPVPKERRATKGGWVDPNMKASPDPKKRPSNLGRDLSNGLEEQALNAALPKAKPKPKTKPKSTSKSKPKVIYTDGPTDGAPDDLKKIKGIGPKFEGDLNSKGIYYFRQIGAWKAADVKMVEELIDSFPGRIKRDEWIKQAKALAKGT